MEKKKQKFKISDKNNFVNLKKILDENKSRNKFIKKIVKRGNFFLIDYSDEIVASIDLSYKERNKYIRMNFIDRLKLFFKIIKNKFLANLNQYSNLREPGFVFMLNKAILGSEKKTRVIQIGSDDGEEIYRILSNFSNSIDSYFLYEPIIKHLESVKDRIRKFTLPKFFHSCAIGDSDKKSKFFIDLNRPNLSSLNLKEQSSHKTIEVDVKNIENILRDHEDFANPILFIMDIEGQEVQVLEGLLKHLSKFPDALISICMELHQLKYTSEYSIQNCLNELIKKFKFQFNYIESAGKVIPRDFKKNKMSPIFSSRGRGVYKANNKDFLLTVITESVFEEISYYPYVTTKASRSVLLSNYL